MHILKRSRDAGMIYNAKGAIGARRGSDMRPFDWSHLLRTGRPLKISGLRPQAVAFIAPYDKLARMLSYSDAQGSAGPHYGHAALILWRKPNEVHDGRCALRRRPAERRMEDHRRWSSVRSLQNPHGRRSRSATARQEVLRSTCPASCAGRNRGASAALAIELTALSRQRQPAETGNGHETEAYRSRTAGWIADSYSDAQ
jgi:hypothetical protein